MIIFGVLASAATAGAAVDAQAPPSDTSNIAIAPLTRASSSAWGAHVYVIDSAEIARSTAPTFSELLQAKVPGLRVLRSGGMVSDGSLVMFRGPMSIASPYTPVLIVDGLRVDARQADTLFKLGAVAPSRWDDIAPEDIERIEVLSGPAAALYGEAADGAIIVTTKSGHGGPLRFSGRVESLTDVAPDEFPANYRRLGVSPTTGQPVRDCRLLTVVAQDCTPTGLDTWNPLEQASPFRKGQSAAAHVAMQGAPLGTGFYLSATAANRQGVLQHDDLSRIGLRGRLTRSFRGGFALDAFGSFMRNNARMGLDGGYFLNSDVITHGLLGTAENDSTHGYFSFGGIPQELVYPSERLRHTTEGVALRWQPSSWFEVAATTGRDNATEHWQIDAFGPPESFPIDEHANEFNQVNSSAIRAGIQYTVGLLGSAATSLVFERRTLHNNTADFQGVTSVFGVNQTFFKTYSSSAVLLQTVTLPNDLVVNGAIQRFARSTLFTSEQKEWFPSLNASWPLRVATRLRLRAAYSEAPGSTPDLNDTAIFYELGRSDVKPHMERVHDLEIGADATLARIATASLTFFRSRATDVYGLSLLATPEGTVLARNAIENDGAEALVGLTLIRVSRLEWSASVSVATLRNRVTLFQDAPQFRRGGVTEQGAPVWAPVALPYTYSDANHDGIIDTSEVRLGAALTAAGPPLPTLEAGMLNELHLPGGLTISALLDYRHGDKIVNTVEEYRCLQRWNCRGVQDPSAPLDEQAAAVAAIKSSGLPVAGFVDDGGFLKIRELSLRWLLPESWSHHLGGLAALTFAGRNLATQTNYHGIDPEVSSSRPNELPRVEFGRNPIPREFVLRLDLGEGSRDR